jgi:predicted phosphodiesterase
MTRLAIVTDVHADVHALRDALAQIDKLGVDQILCCGDLVDYGLFPDETLTLVRERRIVTIRGNHDR